MFIGFHKVFLLEYFGLFKADPYQNYQGSRSTEIGNDLEEPDISHPSAQEADDERAGGDGIHAKGEDDCNKAERERTPHPPVNPGIDNEQGNDQTNVDEGDCRLDVPAIFRSRWLKRLLGLPGSRLLLRGVLPWSGMQGFYYNGNSKADKH